MLTGHLYRISENFYISRHLCHPLYPMCPLFAFQVDPWSSCAHTHTHSRRSGSKVAAARPRERDISHKGRHKGWCAQLLSKTYVHARATRPRPGSAAAHTHTRDPLRAHVCDAPTYNANVRESARAGFAEL